MHFQDFPLKTSFFSRFSNVVLNSVTGVFLVTILDHTRDEQTSAYTPFGQSTWPYLDICVHDGIFHPSLQGKCCHLKIHPFSFHHLFATPQNLLVLPLLYFYLRRVLPVCPVKLFHFSTTLTRWLLAFKISQSVQDSSIIHREKDFLFEQFYYLFHDSWGFIPTWRSDFTAQKSFIQPQRPRIDNIWICGQSFQYYYME